MKNVFGYGEHFGFFEAESDVPPRDLEVSEELDTEWTGMEWQGQLGESEWEWEGEVNRNSRDYIRWVQASLNKILGARLAVDGVMGRDSERDSQPGVFSTNPFSSHCGTHRSGCT